jgi:RNA polymerase sigma-70 factor (ECF subfamily)
MPKHATVADFNALYERYSREVWAATYARCVDAHIALDITQEAYLRLWQQWEFGQKIANPRAWLRRVARNLAIDQTKSYFSRNGTSPPEYLDEMRQHDLRPDELYERKETFARLREAMAQIAEIDRQVLTLHYALDYTFGRIAELLAISRGAVHMRLNRARKRLGGLLLARGVGGEVLR